MITVFALNHPKCLSTLPGLVWLCLSFMDLYFGPCISAVIISACEPISVLLLSAYLASAMVSSTYDVSSTSGTYTYGHLTCPIATLLMILAN